SQLIASAGRRVQFRRTSGTWFRMMTRVGGAQYTSSPARGAWAHSIAEQRKVPHSVRIVSGQKPAPPAWVGAGDTSTETITRAATTIGHVRSRAPRPWTALRHAAESCARRPPVADGRDVAERGGPPLTVAPSPRRTLASSTSPGRAGGGRARWYAGSRPRGTAERA